MSKVVDGLWHNVEGVQQVSYICGYCDSKVAPAVGYFNKEERYPNFEVAYILICPNCNKPTFIDDDGNQTPSFRVGSRIEHLPTNIEALYNEARNAFSVGANNSSILACRKLLMNIAHTKGAEAGKSFVYYVDYLNDNHYIPPDSRDWVDMIRQKGNRATHEIPNMTRDDAEEMIKFTELLLRIVYEMPGNMNKYR